jgi:hypothetical protein|tara:strand:- start:446 stop:874 length:429 start_codon:yes stop_codon:yes gene_type:complete
MNINSILKIITFLLTILFFQLQFSSLKSDDTKLDEEELPAIDPFAGNVGSTNNQVGTESAGETNQNNGLLNNMRLVGTIIGENKKIAIFSSPDGGAFNYEENDSITDSALLIEVFNEVVIVKDESDNKFEVYMNNIIKPSDG